MVLQCEEKVREPHQAMFQLQAVEFDQVFLTGGLALCSRDQGVSLGQRFAKLCMPQFNFTDEQLDAIVAFLKHVNSINDANWPPNDQG